MQSRLFKATYCIFQRTNQANLQFQTFLTLHKQEYSLKKKGNIGFEFLQFKIFTLEKTQLALNPKTKKKLKKQFSFFFTKLTSLAFYKNTFLF